MTRALPPGPPDAIGGATPQPLGRVTLAVANGAIAALLFGSAAMLDWASELPVGPLSDPIVTVAETWDGWMQAAGLDRPAAALRGLRTVIAGD